MRRVSLIFGVFAILAALLPAAEPLATVSSSEPIKLRGAAVPTVGIRSWPLLAGDDIATAGAVALISFRDGSRITLAANSRAKLEAVGARTNVRLLDGSMQFNLSEKSTLRVYSRDTLRSGASGTVTAGSASRAGSGAADNIRTQALRPPPPISRTR